MEIIVVAVGSSSSASAPPSSESSLLRPWHPLGPWFLGLGLRLWLRLGSWEIQLHGFILAITVRLSSVGVMVGVEAVITILAVAS